MVLSKSKKASRSNVTKSVVSKQQLILLVIVVLVVCGALCLQAFKMSQIKSQQVVTETLPSTTPTPPFMLPETRADGTIDTSNWKTFVKKSSQTDGTNAFTVKYPPKWSFEQVGHSWVYYPYGNKSTSPAMFSSDPMIVINSLGHGGAPTAYQRSFPGGEARYGWDLKENQANGFANFTVGNSETIFEIYSIPVKDAAEADTLKKTFDAMLMTYQPQ